MSSTNVRRKFTPEFRAEAAAMVEASGGNIARVAQVAGGSLDFLYRSTEIRQRVEHLRSRQRGGLPDPPTAPNPDQPSSVIRTLTAQVAELNRQHRDEVRALRQALEVAQGENLELRRHVGHRTAQEAQ